MKTSIILAASTALLPLSAIAAETISCDTLPTCAELGYDDQVSLCPKDYLTCPFDKTQGKCIYEAAIGQIGYFTKAPGNGWLLCDGKIYNAKKYPDLAAALASKYVLSSSRIQVPDYRGDFLRVSGGNSGTVNTRQAEGLPNIYGNIGSNAGRAQFTTDISSGAFYAVSSGLSHFSNDGTETAGVKVYFDASEYNSIYGNSSHVTPVNTAVYAYIYAGKVDPYTDNPDMPSCSQGQYYYADGTCSSSYNSSKTLRGIVSSVSTSSHYIRYIVGGVNSTAENSTVLNYCASVNGSLARYTDWKKLPTNIPTTQSVVRSPQAGYYWNAINSDRYYCSSASSCSIKSGTATTSAKYYCIVYDYYTE